MSIYRYSVLKGDPQPGQVAGPHDKPPHYQFNVNAGGQTFQVAVNIESTDKSQVLYLIQQNFTPAGLDQLPALPQAMNALAGAAGPPALDFVRGRVNGQPYVTRAAMQMAPIPGTGAASNMKNEVIQFLTQATDDPDGVLYAFGGQYTDGTGIHEIHMNQGNPAGDHDDENGVWSDGGILIQLPAANTWAALFIAFQTEVWTTNDVTGDPL